MPACPVFALGLLIQLLLCPFGLAEFLDAPPRLPRRLGFLRQSPLNE